MDISKIGTLRFIPEFNGNRRESVPLVVKYKSIRREWRVRLVEASEEAEQIRRESEAEGADKSEAADKMLRLDESLSADLLASHITGVEGLTDGGRPVDRDGLIALLNDVPPLAQEVFEAIVTGNQYTEEDAKN